MVVSSEFWGGPWDGRRLLLSTIYPEFFVPFFDNGAEMLISVQLVMNDQHGSSVPPCHHYKRGTVSPTRGVVYFYRGVIRE